MISPRAAGIAFPYLEGLRLDEAMHPLALLPWDSMERRCLIKMRLG
jgi:hypothetical protein